MNIDKEINVLMQGIENPSLTVFSKIMDIAFDPVILVVISVLITAMFFIKDKKKQGVFYLSVMGIAAVLIKGFKFIFSRARPVNSILEETSNAFPSGHATIVVVFFGLIAFFIFNHFKKNKKFKCRKISIIFSVVAISLITGFTRIYLRVHWFTDVIAGFILGGIILLSGIIYYKKRLE